MEINTLVGSRIRLFRRAKGLTLVQFAEKIHKSKASVSKYETGDISIDVETLFDIARALDISVHQLLDCADAAPSLPLKNREPFFVNGKLYLYFFDGRINRLVRGFLVLKNDGGEEDRATLYLNVDSTFEEAGCRSLYCGTAFSYDTFTHFSLENQNNRIEHLFLCVMNPLDRATVVSGLISGISSRPFLPVSIKCLLSSSPLVEDDSLRQQLIFDKQDFKWMKRLNMLIVDSSPRQKSIL